ncbi:MAG: hypothetical protein L6R43_11705 [Planctomycetes bacterium]|nr:hypothetical protein [Planctomycetota bacterium]
MGSTADARRMIAGLLLAAASLGAGGSAAGDGRALPPESAPRAVAGARRPSRLYFEENRGQVDPAVRFLARPRGFQAYLADAEAVFVLLHDPGREGARGDVVRMAFEGRTPGPAPRASGLRPSRSHYFLGNDPRKWVKGVRHHDGVLQESVWPGVDLRWRGNDAGNLEYDFLLAPGADPAAIRLRFTGAGTPSLSPSGDLLLPTAGGVLRHGRPRLHQEARGRRRPVEGRFLLGADGAVGFAVGARDPALPLVIDPEVVFSTYHGGSGSEDLAGISSGPEGNVVVGGRTGSLDFPLVAPLDGSITGVAYDLFVSSFERDGATLQWSTYVGGSGVEHYGDLACGADGAAVLVGGTGSDNYPTVGPVQGTRGGSDDIAVTRIAPGGDALQYSTYLGGSSAEYALAVAVDGDGSAVVAGTAGSGFPRVGGFQSFAANGNDGFVSRFSPDGSALLWSTAYGGTNGGEYARSVSFDGEGDLFIAGQTDSTNLPLVSPRQSLLSGTYDAFVAKVQGDGAALLFSTYLGGSGVEDARGIAVDAEGRPWVAGFTSSAAFPLQEPLQASFGGLADAFVAQYAADGSSLLFSTYIGGSADENAYGIAAGRNGEMLVAGYTSSTGFPVLDPFQEVHGGGEDGFLLSLDAETRELLHSTFLGGSDEERVTSIGVRGDGATLLAGQTFSTDFPLVEPRDAGWSGGWDGFVTVFEGTGFPPVDLKAVLIGLTEVEVSWIDDNEPGILGGFEIERRTGGGAFAPLATVGAGVLRIEDAGLAPDTTYVYRVRGVTDSGTTDWSEEDDVTTPPPPTSAPFAPTDLLAEATGPRTVALSWTDNSADEDFFVLARGTDGAFYSTIATPRLGATAAEDGSVLPGRTYWYLVRAVNPVGSSLNALSGPVTTPSTLGFLLAKGKAKDSPKAAKDSLEIEGALSLGDGAELDALDPRADGIEVYLGGFTGQRVLRILPEDGTWKTRKAKSTWKSPRGESTKAKVVFDAATGVLSVKLSRMNFAAAPASPLVLTLGSGEEGVVTTNPWTERKPGLLQFP